MKSGATASLYDIYYRMWCYLQALEALAFNDDGSEFLCTHADGSYVVWTTGKPLHPKENPYTPYGQLKHDCQSFCYIYLYMEVMSLCSYCFTLSTIT